MSYCFRKMKSCVNEIDWDRIIYPAQYMKKHHTICLKAGGCKQAHPLLPVFENFLLYAIYLFHYLSTNKNSKTYIEAISFLYYNAIFVRLNASNVINPMMGKKAGWKPWGINGHNTIIIKPA